MHVPHATNFYGKFEILNFDIFIAKKVVLNYNGNNFCVLTRKKYIIYQKLSTQNFKSNFNGHRLFAQILAAQNSKGTYESRKILDFVKKKEKFSFLKFFNFFCCLFQFLIILNVSH
jgi:hypothetical protein